MNSNKKHIILNVIFILLFSIYWESISTEFWVYNRERMGIFLLNHLPVIVLLYWMFVFFVSLFVSEKLYQIITGKQEIPLFDKKLYVLDIISFGIIGTILEALFHTLNWFEYNADLHWSLLPLINLPFNAIAGYFGVGMFIPTTMRYYRKHI